MPQHVRAALFHRGDRRQVLLHNIVYLFGIHAFTAVAEQQGGFCRVRKFSPSGLYIQPESLLQRSAERYEPLFAALARHTQRPAAEVNIRNIEQHQLRASQPGLIEHFEERTVAFGSKAIAESYPFEQQLHVFLLHNDRQAFAYFGQDEILRRIVGHFRALAQKTEPGLDGRNFSAHTAGRGVVAQQIHHPGAKVQGADIFRIGNFESGG